MILAVVAKLRHGTLMRWRIANGYTSQHSAAVACGISYSRWLSVESLRFNEVSHATILAISEFTGLLPEEIIPKTLHKKMLGFDRIAFRDVPDKLLESIVDDGADKQLLVCEIRDALETVLRTLTFREREVLRMRYGLDGNQPKSLGEVAKILGVTRERVRQVEARAIRKLQHPVRSEKLCRFLPERIMDREKKKMEVST
jgi:RNA polymerase sigma factor (sigma-70 family)